MRLQHVRWKVSGSIDNLFLAVLSKTNVNVFMYLDYLMSGNWLSKQACRHACDSIYYDYSSVHISFVRKTLGSCTIISSSEVYATIKCGGIVLTCAASVLEFSGSNPGSDANVYFGVRVCFMYNIGTRFF